MFLLIYLLIPIVHSQGCEPPNFPGTYKVIQYENWAKEIKIPGVLITEPMKERRRNLGVGKLGEEQQLPVASEWESVQLVANNHFSIQPTICQNRNWSYTGRSAGIFGGQWSQFLVHV
ncbi:unnamed protein product [Allacma fusca]|uniref:Uncharacterized protein n=1 Tax=Allacma fusca TaxID=39272 RepID=A0A8J2JZ49_9HEXA|nr:unnamed protein product [Allacma fusca]